MAAATLSNHHLSGAGKAFVRNAWYVAGWSDELSMEKPRACGMLGDPVVLYRRSDGCAVALEDRCIHRSLPLSVGRIRGDVIECGYHGMQFDWRGACVRIPGQIAIPQAACVRSYPVVERHGCIWVWMGEQALADATDITPFPWMDKPGWQRTRLHARIECNYQLVIDNLLDLSHLAFVHGTTVGSMELADSAQVRTEATERGVKVSRWTLDVPPARTYAQFGKYDCHVDRWQLSEFQAPGTFVIRNGSARAGTGAMGGGGDQRWEFIVCHGITPESDRVTNYFWAVNHDFGADDPEGTAEFHRQSQQMIGEDIAIFGEQQRMLERTPDAHTVNISYDAGPIQARRLLTQMIAAERAGVPLREASGVPA
jgi:phenylpropionate dioxygenase-like ring-hydroxylating dioxygenase large terminal subunit